MPAMRDTPWPILVLAAAVRAAACMQPAIPARDGTWYLWLGQQVAAGRGEELFTNVFHPLYPAAIGALLGAWPGLDVVAAGRIVAVVCSACAVVPLWSLTRRLFGVPAAHWAGAVFAIGAWFVRHPVECMSEGPFHLAALAWAAALFAGPPRVALAGFAGGLAFLLRPEGALLIVAGALLLLSRDGRRVAVRHAVAGALTMALLPVGALATGAGFVLLPKAAFVWADGVGGAAGVGEAVWHYLAHLVRLPGDAWEGLGYAVLPLLVLGLWQQWRGGARTPLLLALPLLAFCLVIPLLRSNHRFVSGLGVLLLPFAGAACVRLAVHGRAAAAIALVLVASEAKLWFGGGADRTAERDVGRWLGGELSPGQTLASDMPRLVFFAGLRPPPPRTIAAADLRAWAGESTCRFVALRQGRTPAFVGELAGLGYAEVELPPDLAVRVRQARIAVWRRGGR